MKEKKTILIAPASSLKTSKSLWTWGISYPGGSVGQLLPLDSFDRQSFDRLSLSPTTVTRRETSES